MDLIAELITQLKNMVSLRYVDPLLRERALTLLKRFDSADQCIPGLQICQEYIAKVQEVHEKMLQQISTFLEQLTPFINQCQHTIQSTQQQLIQTVKIRKIQLSQQHDIEYDMKQTMEMMSRQLNLRDQENKELVIKLQEKDSIIYNLERQQSQYFKKMEQDFQKQQKALQQSFIIIVRLQQEVNSLKFQNLRLRQNDNISHFAIAIIDSIQVRNDGNSTQKVNCSHEYSIRQEQDQHNNFSLINGRSQRLSQLKRLHTEENQIQQREELVIGCSRQGSPGLMKVETLKQLLNVSVQKQYKMQYNTYECIEEREEKQNHRVNWLKDSKSNSKQKCQQWGVNNSIEVLEQQQASKRSVKEFKLAFQGNNNKQRIGHELDKVQLNPYYAYFLIACQNVKIRSKYFQQFCLIEAGPCWQLLLSKSVPLHEWEKEIDNYLISQRNQL